MGAVKYARTNMTKYIATEETQARLDKDQARLKTLSDQNALVLQALGLVAYGQSQRQEIAFYKELTKPVKWEELATLFEHTVYEVFGLPVHSVVTQTLQTGISVLKNALCEEIQEDELFMMDDEKEQAQMRHAFRGDDVNMNGTCPTCEPKMRELGKDLPNASHSQTSIACSVTGQIMND